MTAYPWLTLRGRTYYLRAPVPTDIKDSFGRAEIWKSLRTQDRKVAIKKLRKETAIVAEEFEKHRASQHRLAAPPLWELTDQQIKAVEDVYLEHLLDEDEELRLSGFEGRDFDEEMDTMEGFDEVSREAYAKGSVSSFIRGEAEEVLSWDGIEVRLDERSPSWPRVFRALHAATIKANKAIRERNSGEVVETPRVELKAFRAASKPTLEEAKDFYVAERVSGSEFARRKRINRLEANMRSVKEALGEVPPLPDFTVDHAYAVRDYLLKKRTLKPSSVRRELNDIKGIFSLYKVKKLRSMTNPFEGLELPKNVEADKDAREPLPPEVIEGVRSLVMEKANPELALIWRLLEGTGCRLAEITGLRVEDVLSDSKAPYLRIVSHPSRRLKSKSSEREVPLVGDASVAASEALQAAKGKNFLFERYASPVGPNTASQSLMKWLRKVSKDPRHAVHSLRHNMADRCDIAGVNPTDKAAILGHLSGGASERYYGSRAARRAALARAMGVAFKVSIPTEGP
nr:integrase [Rhizobium sp. TCK]